MPNHVTNRFMLQGSPEDIAAFVDLMFVEIEEDGEKVKTFDFNRIVPMPDYLEKITEGTISECFYHILKRDGEMRKGWDWMNKSRDNCLGPMFAVAGMSDEELETLLRAADEKNLESALLMVRAVKETGFRSWYDWSISNWGTKWGAYGFKVISEEPCIFKFDTAWSAPVPVLAALGERFPDLGIHCSSFDEGGGFACDGWINPPDGEAEYHQVEPSDEMYEKVYGQAPEKYDEDQDEDASEADEEVDSENNGDKPIWSA
jgi:hypothetical protein